MREHELIDERWDAEASAGEVCVELIDQIFADNDLDRSDQTIIAVGVGPGPYTSTRVGLSIARAIGFGLDIPVVGICSHDALAAQFAQDQPGQDFIVATDARRREVYWARYDSTGARKHGPQVGKPQELVETHPDISTYVGNGFERYPDLAQTAGPKTPSARWIGELAFRELQRGSDIPTDAHSVVDHSETGETLIPADQSVFAPFPLYIRRPDAVEPAVKR